MSSLSPVDPKELAALGVATLYEASGRAGLVEGPLIQVVPGSRAAGPARTVLCGQDDNLMVHAVMDQVRPQEVLVLTMPRPAPVALVGELLAIQAKRRGAAALLVDAAVRDVEALRDLGLPIWTRYVSVRGATKDVVGAINVPVTVGGAEIRPGDWVVLDADGAVVIAAERLPEVVQAARARAVREQDLRRKLEAGQLTYDLHGLRAKVEGTAAPRSPRP
ncbi:MAG: 4-carboxy-4-hydroxy-2-oxoadipate aldolase/oxaloacetate decarboxylase [Armatimonadota bacterium]|nr:4-carboxy-4-hydroxy-2-oxoadipate aldolase/oxaloacetate decarboxylase [Armatimonadota bacterium]MDR7443890.1 4-carboxy-4-hydroxy-2-oxoadipate aldolase/oxaloacetate decarboxylase [Armatimonadota bacterium]MDR7571071.1 4-carboxy-4-hydroxy-2-oxoadipate aldolase/oxaloacetate decarboxylase [Armatimonadota bacterium]MDR7615468.1 4-carboxy-4-hydroxy-2-oxoadipate aldolase/oxaloacetate decarboxylase [Armatimonadota bacterium]